MTDVTLYRNVGAPFGREDGTRVERGEVFVPTEIELIRRAYKLEKIGERETSTLTRPIAREIDAEGWNLRMKPALYLQLDPDGPYADAARRSLGKASRDVPGDDSSRRRDLAAGPPSEDED